MNNITGDFSKNFTKAVFEVYTGIELAAPLTKIGTYGRILGRNTAKLYADISIVLGLVMTTGGTFTSGATPILATAGGPIGIATATASPALIAGGIVATAHGIVLNSNYDKLSKIDVTKNKFESKNPESPGKLQKQIEKGHAPKTIKRVDRTGRSFEKNHVHFKDSSALNFDGTWKHGKRSLTNKEIKWLLKNGWKIP